MKCQFCPTETNGAYFKGKPICPRCWNNKKQPNPKDIAKFYQKWMRSK